MLRSGPRARGSRRGRHLRSPAQYVAVAFGIAIVIGTLLLLLPGARAGEGSASPLVALFTATSAVCVTGLVVVDTPTYWSGFGQVIILGLIQIGGLGIMTLASLLGLLVFRRLGLRSRITAAAETKTVDVGDVRRVLAAVVGFALVFEGLTATVLTLRLWLGYDYAFGRAVRHGVFHAVSAYNNAGFALYSDNLIGFLTDPVVTLVLCMAVIAGGIGFPVLYELRHELLSPRTWTVHTRITVATYAVLIGLGWVLITALEWGNDGTFGTLGVGGKLLGGFFHAVMPRTAGFNAIDYADATPATLLVTDALMFIGGGSGGTAGGIKVTTFSLLAFVILAEARGQHDVTVGKRRIPRQAQRQALSIALLGVGVVFASTVLLLALTGLSLNQVLFEVVSAFATVGLSTGITAQVGTGGQLLLTALMFLGRLGPITLASALALRHRPRLYELPEERPIIG